MDAKRSDYITRLKQQVTRLLDDITALQASHTEYNLLGYDQSLTTEDLVGENDHLTPAMVADGVAKLTTLNDALLADNGAILTALLRIRR